MFKKKLLVATAVAILTTSAFATEVTPTGIKLDTSWKVKIYNYAKDNFDHTAWGFGHAERNYLLSMKIAKSENLKIDEDALFAAAFLHDIGSFNRVKGEDHAVTSANMVGEKLKKFGFPMEKLETVKGAILGHFYNAKVPKEPTAIVLHDADALDFMGNIGITRVLSLTTRIESWVPTLDKSFGTLGRMNKKFEALIHTKAGKEIAQKRAKEAEKFFEIVEKETYGFKAL